MLTHIARVMETELWFVKRCIKFIKMTLMSENNAVFTIGNMDRYSSYSNQTTNMKPFNDKYGMDERNVYTNWKCICEKNEDVIIICMQVKELVDMMDICIDGALNKGKCSEIIECLCTE